MVSDAEEDSAAQRKPPSRLQRAFLSDLYGMRTDQWLRLLIERRFAIDPRYLPRAIGITVCSVFNSGLAGYEGLRYGAAVRATRPPPPVFILGHWRSGTTFLENLLAHDPRLAAPTLHQVIFPSTFLTTQSWFPSVYRDAMGSKRVMDEVEWSPETPEEDEFALNVMTGGLSSRMGGIWPRVSAHYDRYLTFRDASEAERARWSEALRRFVAKLHFATGRVPLLKSPHHTARIRLLHRLFPDARYIHIHRDPSEVFQSNRAMWLEAADLGALQRPDQTETDERILTLYRLMHEAYFEDRSLLPPGRLVEIPFADLRRNPLGTLSQAYETLALPGFAEAAPRMQRYLDRQKSYRQNRHVPMSAAQRQGLRAAAALAYENWDYEPA